MKNKPHAVLIALASVALATATHAESESPTSPTTAADAPDQRAASPSSADETETVLVVGEQPGPGVWKVSSGDHVMWILGTHGPLPKGMVWRSQHVESLIAQSQEVLYPGRVKIDAGIGLLKGVTLLPALIKASKNPEGATLKDVLPPDTYTKWLVLRDKYIDDPGRIEKLRPYLAADELHEASVKKSGLAYTRFDKIVNKAAKKHKVRIHTLPTVERKMQVANPRKMLREASKAEYPDIPCFTTNLDRIEPHIESMKVRANAWATGDIESLRRPEAPIPLNCTGTMMNALQTGDIAEDAGAKEVAARLNEEMQLASKESDQNWLDAAEAALARNRSTFAVLPLRQALSPRGYIARLREKGYAVEDPK